MVEVVSYGEIFGNVDMREVARLSDNIGKVIVIKDAKIITGGKFGDQALIYAEDGEYKSSSTVIISQLKRIMDWKESHPDVKGIYAKVTKVKNYYAFSSAKNDVEVPDGYVDIGEIFGLNVGKVPNITDKMNQTMTIIGADEYEGSYGPYWVIHTTDGDYRTSSIVLGQQAMEIDDYLKENPEVVGVKVKLTKVKNYYKFVSP